MKGKVTCTCGWSWNKSDSSKKDMYICHECGRDNSNNMKNGGWLDSYDKAQDGEALYTPPKSQYKRLYGHAKDYSQGENEKMRIDPNTGYGYFPPELSTFQQKEVPNSPWNVSRFLFDPFIRNESQGVHNAKYDKERKRIDNPIEEDYFSLGLNRRERYDAAKNDITNYYKEDLKLNDHEVEKKVDDTMDLIRKMRRTEEMMQKHNSTYKDFQNYDPQEVFKSAVGFDELFPSKSMMGDKKLSPAQAKRAYKMFQKTWRGTSGKEARQNSREELKKAKEAFELAKKQKEEGLLKSVKPDPNYVPEDFANGGILKNGGWLDNYGTQENYNDYKVSAPEGFKGNGYSNVGRNYSPAWGGQFQMGGKLNSSIPVIEDAGGYNEEGIWVPDWEAMTAQAKKLGSKRVKTRHGSLIVFNDNWEVIGVDDNPDAPDEVNNSDPRAAMQMGGNVYPVNYVPQAQEGQTMFKKPSILKQDYIDPIYSYSERTKLYPGEEKVFKERTDVAGMAAEDDHVIINPYSPISKEMKDLVRINETARLAMRNGYPRPDFELTPKQQEFFNTVQNGKPYSEDLQDIRETIAARIMTGDDSAQDYTEEQQVYADKLADVLERSKEYATGMSGMMKSKIGMGNAFEQPAIKRMSQAMPKTGMTPEGIGTHYMSSVDNYAVPELQDLGEEELTMVDPDSRSREAIRFNSPEEANYFAKHYKEVAPMSTTFRDLNSFQTGGSIPGSVGFTYARTKGIPSNGPYAKKTMASAQNGVDMYDNPLIARMVNNANINRSYYDPRLNTMNMGSDYNMWRDEETGELLTGDDLAYHQDKMLAHENYHAIQHKEGRDNYDIAHSTDNEQWARMQKRPEVMSTDAVWNNFYNRSAIENIQDYANKINEVPEARLVNQQLLFDKVLDRERYDNPSNLEGEAKFYEDTGVKFQNGGEMRYYQNGLDWKPKGMKNGGWLDGYKEGGIIKDDRGQWEHPGEITEINSPYITMQGVPYPVLGISDTGDAKLMKPGKDYKFKGKKVTEFPMAKNGLRQEQKGLVNLDNLLNFTNYNKPQPGGWLSKYE